MNGRATEPKAAADRDAHQKLSTGAAGICTSKAEGASRSGRSGVIGPVDCAARGKHFSATRRVAGSGPVATRFSTCRIRVAKAVPMLGPEGRVSTSERRLAQKREQDARRFVKVGAAPGPSPDVRSGHPAPHSLGCRRRCAILAALVGIRRLSGHGRPLTSRDLGARARPGGPG